MTLDADMAADIETVFDDEWAHSIAIQRPSVTTSDNGVETVSLASVATILGYWQPLKATRTESYLQQLPGFIGRLVYMALVPISADVRIKDVLTYSGQSGEVALVEKYPGHNRIILQARRD